MTPCTLSLHAARPEPDVLPPTDGYSVRLTPRHVRAGSWRGPVPNSGRVRVGRLVRRITATLAVVAVAASVATPAQASATADGARFNMPQGTAAERMSLFNRDLA